MAAYDLQEQEQLDAIKQWWARYGNAILGLAAAVVLSIAGWRGWQWYQDDRANQAMAYFEALEAAARENDEESLSRVKAAAQTLRSDYPTTLYATRGALIAAQALADKQDYDAARAQLQWVAASSDAALAPLARLRLAAVLLDEKRYDEALAQLDNPPAAFATLYADRRADVLAAQGKRDEARAIWETVHASLVADGESQLAAVVQLKIDALMGATS